MKQTMGFVFCKGLFESIRREGGEKADEAKLFVPPSKPTHYCSYSQPPCVVVFIPRPSVDDDVCVFQLPIPNRIHRPTLILHPSSPVRVGPHL
ncbi:hypothetical protein CDEST_08411 [Colletotrichum destructivum]|uniref:Uncharacterized protein n=1 Tax=Colletotrichum destructivum TaxID=34406 RepID=A0AAX4IJ10_9PEZI|nr:hypothetical protein CDEST_08411 [Colletotrichum destructivum]